jgi:hypothetical protein
LSISGYANQNWKNIENSMVKILDQDGDGKLTYNDFLIIENKYLNLLSRRIPSSTGFGTAFWFGYRGKFL